MHPNVVTREALKHTATHIRGRDVQNFDPDLKRILEKHFPEAKSDLRCDCVHVTMT